MLLFSLEVKEIVVSKENQTLMEELSQKIKEVVKQRLKVFRLKLLPVM